MYNNKAIELNLTRHEVFRINLALIHLICEMKNELNNEELSEVRKKRLISSANMWETLMGKVKNQFELQDK